MKIFIENKNGTLWLSLSILRWVGLHIPKVPTGWKLICFRLYSFFWIINVVGIFIVVQIGDLVQVWGNLTLMTNISYFLFTILAFLAKIINLMMRRDEVQAIIDECDEELKSERRPEGKKIIKISDLETTWFQCVFAFFAVLTAIGWALRAEQGEFPLRAWYPYDTSKSPAYELTYTHQCIAFFCGAVADMACDIMITSLIAVTRCRSRLLTLSLRTLCHDIPIDNKLLTPEQEKIVSERIRICVAKHQAILNTAAQIQVCFTEVILAQLSVSVGIICATAYQLAFENSDDFIGFFSMTTYLVSVILEVFLFCYQGNQLSEDSADIADAAYECPWYLFSTPLRRSILIIMARSRRVAVITAGGFTELSLDSFMAIIKASYSFFTVLQQVEHGE